MKNLLLGLTLFNSVSIFAVDDHKFAMYLSNQNGNEINFKDGKEVIEVGYNDFVKVHRESSPLICMLDKQSQSSFDFSIKSPVRIRHSIREDESSSMFWNYNGDRILDELGYKGDFIFRGYALRVSEEELAEKVIEVISETGVVLPSPPKHYTMKLTGFAAYTPNGHVIGIDCYLNYGFNSFGGFYEVFNAQSEITGLKIKQFIE